MTLAELNYCVLNENSNRRRKFRDIIRLAWYTAYFNRIEKLEPLKKYLSETTVAEKVAEKSVITPEDARNIYNNLRKKSGGKINA